MSKTVDEIRKELDAKIPRDAVSQREGSGGKSFSYLQGHYVIARMNEIFGQGNWGYDAREVRCVYTGEVQGKQVAHYIAVVNLWASVGVGEHASFTDVGYGDGSDKYNPGKAHELAAKEAVTDAFKRAAKNLGMSMGLALYDKEQTNVDDGEEKKQLPKVAQGAPKTTGPIGVGPSSGKPAEAAPQATSTEGGSEAPTDRERINELILKTGKVIAAKRLKTPEGKQIDLGALRIEMKARYGVDASTKLSDSQAKEFYQYLTSLNNQNLQ